MQKQYSVLGYKAILLSKYQLFQATKLYRLSTKGSSHKALGPISQSLVYWGQSSTKLVRFQTSEQCDLSQISNCTQKVFSSPDTNGCLDRKRIEESIIEITKNKLILY